MAVEALLSIAGMGSRQLTRAAVRGSAAALRGRSVRVLKAVTTAAAREASKGHRVHHDQAYGTRYEGKRMMHDVADRAAAAVTRHAFKKGGSRAVAERLVGSVRTHSYSPGGSPSSTVNKVMGVYSALSPRDTRKGSAPSITIDKVQDDEFLPRVDVADFDDVLAHEREVAVRAAGREAGTSLRSTDVIIRTGAACQVDRTGADGVVAAKFAPAFAIKTSKRSVSPSTARLLLAGDPSKLDLTKVRSHSFETQARKIAMAKELEEVLLANTIRPHPSAESMTVNEDGVREWLFSTPISRYNHEEQAQIFKKLYDNGMYNLAVELIMESNNHLVLTDPVLLEFFCRAQMRSEYCNPALVESLVSLLESQNGISGETASIRGNLEAVKAKIAGQAIHEMNYGGITPHTATLVQRFLPGTNISDRSSVYAAYNTSLSRSLTSHMEAFSLTHDPRYGITAIHRLMAVQSHSPTPARALEISRLIQKVRFTCIREGGMESNVFPVMAALIECEILENPTNTKIIGMMKKLVKDADNSSKVGTFIERLMEINNFAELNGIKEVADAAIACVAYRDKETGTMGKDEEKDLETAIRNAIFDYPSPLDLYPPSASVAAKASAWVEEGDEEVPPTHEAFTERTTTYRGFTSNFISGNFSFGGQLPSQNINRKDLRVFEKLIDKPIKELLTGSDDTRKLSEVTDEDEFLEIVDRITRQVFKTDELNLEVLDSDGHAVYDDLVLRSQRAMGVDDPDDRKLIGRDSATSISMTMAMRLGDCRHHSQVKQLLFDVWEKRLIDTKLREIDALIDAGGDTSAKEAELRSLLNRQLRTMDAEISLPIKMTRRADGYEVPERDAEGRFILDPSGKFQKVEEHTMNALFDYKNVETGELRSVRLADAFYQNTYNFKAAPVDISGDFVEAGIQVGTVKGVNAAGEEVEIPVKIKAASYTKESRSAYDRSSAHLKLLGMRADLSVDEAVEAITSRPKVDAVHAAMGSSPALEPNGGSRLEARAAEILAMRKAAVTESLREERRRAAADEEWGLAIAGMAPDGTYGYSAEELESLAAAEMLERRDGFEEEEVFRWGTRDLGSTGPARGGGAEGRGPSREAEAERQ